MLTPDHRHRPPRQADRIARASAELADAFVRGADFLEVAESLRQHLDPPQIARGAAAHLAAMPLKARRHLAHGALRDADDYLKAERQRQTAAWLRHVRGSSYRPPSLTPEQQRRAEAIDLGTTPRARLADAWTAAAPRDRRDLIRRATGRAT